MIVFIPSKGRNDTVTHKLFIASGFKVYHFIEPDEIESYNVPKKIDIKLNNQGMSYVRNFMLDYARDNGIKHFIACDDDITHFGKAKGGRAIKGDNADDLVPVFKVFCKSDLAMAGINQRQFAWSEKKTYKLNYGKVEGCSFFNSEIITWRYKENSKEDRDFMMQCLDNRENFAFFCKVFFNTTAIGTNIGGLHDQYKSKADSIWAKKLLMDWPKYAKIINQYGRTDCKLDYKQKAKDMGLVVK